MSTTPDKSARKGRKEKEPLKVTVSVAVRFGDEEDDRVVLLDDREIVMLGSVFRYRDKIARYTVTALMRLAMFQPRLAAKVLPGLSHLTRKK